MRSHAKASSAGSSTRQAMGLGRVVRGAFAERHHMRRADGSGVPSNRFLIALFVLAGAFGSIVTPASAALPTHPELPALNQTGFQRACGLAVDSEGNRYVADYSSDVVKVFSPAGVPITSFTPSVNAEAPCGLAVDSNGNVYVSGFEYDVVKYKPSAFPPTSSTTYEADTTTVSGTGVISEEGYGVAVDPATDVVYVSAFGHITTHQPDGTVISESIGESAGGGAAQFASVAVRGSTGKIYAYDRLHKKAYVISADGSEVLAEINGSTTQVGSFTLGYLGIAVDQSNGHFYLADISNHVVDEFDSGGELVSEIPVSSSLATTNPSAVAVDDSGGENDGDVFLSAGMSPSSVFAYGPLTYAEFFKLEVKKTGAGKGTVTSSPAGVDCGSTCNVAFQEGSEVTLSAGAEAGSKFASWQGCDTVIGSECKVAMSAKRQVAAKFTTKPAIEAENVSPLDTSALLEATINPNGEETSYQFEFLSEAAYQANGESFTGLEEPLKIPASPESIGNGDGGVPVAVQVPGLTAHTPYRFRVVASNVVGTSESNAVAFTTYLPPNVFELCPNDAYRAGPGASLPDCRAYEQASPVDKNGGDLTGDVLAAKASINGDRISFQATSPIPGGEGSQTFTPLYLASRGASGWSTRGLLPPQSEGRRAKVLGWNPDFAHVFEWALKIGSPNFVALLDRSTADGTVSTIVPHSAGFEGPEIAGSSSDGSVVFIESFASLTANAPIGKPNLYAWDRETGTMRLAGVFNDGEAPAAGAFAGPYDWMNEFVNGGGVRGSYYVPDMHAIAADGSSVYFTAAKTGQLYLRLNPAKPQSALNDEEECIDPELACTILISASQKHNGTGSEGSDSAGPHPAAFMRASVDGSLAYFTSSEMLTENANTGPEQPAAQIGRAKIGAGEGEEIKPSLLPKHAIGVTVSPDNEYLYWADPQAGTIGRAKLNGDGSPSEINDEFIVPGETKAITHPKKEPGIFHSAPSTPRYVAVDDEYVYWTNTGPLGEEDVTELQEPIPVEGGGTIGRAKIGSNGPVEIQPEFITGASNPKGIAVNDSYIYWANVGRFAGHLAIARATIDGGAVQTEFSNSTASFGEPVGLAIDGSHVYFDVYDKSNNQGYMARIPLDGGPRDLTYIGPTRLDGVAIDGSYVYWTAATEGVVGRRPISSFAGSCREDSSCEPEYFEAEGSLAGIAADGTHLYWAANGEGSANPGNDLYRYNTATNELLDLTPDTSPNDVNGAEVRGVLGASDDGSYIYFVANGVLAGGASPGNCHGTTPENVTGTCNVYLYHDGETTFISRVEKAEDWRSRAYASGAQSVPKTSRVSADGRTLLFLSKEKLTFYDNKGKPEIYRYQVGDPSPMVCVSCNPTGLQPTGEPSLGAIQATGVTSDDPTPVLTRNLSADGDRVFFETTEALVVSDTNGDKSCPPATLGGWTCQDVYEWEEKGTGSCDSEVPNGGCLYLISSGKSEDASYLLDASADGDDVFFFTRSQLTGQDEDQLLDVYDARVGGGFASQNEPPPPTPCEGEACKDGAPASPDVSSPVTPLFSGPGNPKPHHKKAKPRKKKHRHQYKRHAKSKGRAHR